MTPVSWYKLKCEIAHSSFQYGEVVLCTMLPFEGDSSLSLISYLLLIKPKVSILKVIILDIHKFFFDQPLYLKLNLFKNNQMFLVF